MAILPGAASPREKPMSENDVLQFPDEASKTRRKRQMEDLQHLGEALVKLPPSQFEQMALPEDLRAAVADCRRFTRHEAVRRQMQFIGRLMRGIDGAPIRAQLDALRGRSAQATARLHRAERWRERLLEDDAALTELLREAPELDSTRLRQLVRAARQEAALAKPPRAARELFRLLRAALENTEAAAAQERPA